MICPDWQAALGHLMLDPGRLDGMQRSGRAKAFDGGDLAVHIGSGKLAGTHRHAIDMHRAGAAPGNAAAIFGACQAEFIAQDPEQRHVRLDIDLERLPIDRQLHGGPL